MIMHVSAIQAQYLPLYSKIPNYIEAPNEESAQVRGVYMISMVSVPGYAFFSAGEEGDAKPCVVICPGGGYGIFHFQWMVEGWAGFGFHQVVEVGRGMGFHHLVELGRGMGLQ